MIRSGDWYSSGSLATVVLCACWYTGSSKGLRDYCCVVCTWRCRNMAVKEDKVRSRKGIETEGQHRPVVLHPLFNWSFSLLIHFDNEDSKSSLVIISVSNVIMSRYATSTSVHSMSTTLYLPISMERGSHHTSSESSEWVNEQGLASYHE